MRTSSKRYVYHPKSRAKIFIRTVRSVNRGVGTGEIVFQSMYAGVFWRRSLSRDVRTSCWGVELCIE